MTIKIYYRAHVYTAAAILAQQLIKLGYTTELIDRIDPQSEDLHIIYCAFAANAIPKNYIVYQTEVPGSRWFTPNYMSVLKNAIAIWDYSTDNLKAYEQLNKPVNIVTPGVDLKLNHPYSRDIDILFYGAINERRRRLLNDMNVRVQLTEKVYGEEMYKLLQRAKVVINLHYYNNAPLEVFRINESLSYGCHVISESVNNGDTIRRYYKNIFFADSPVEFALCAEKALVRPFDYNLEGLKNTWEVINALAALPQLQRP